MANEEHLRILNSGVAAWNWWRKDNPDERPDLSGAGLFRADLSEANLSGARLSGARLSRTDLIWADLAGADFSGATAFKTAFIDVDLSEVGGLETVRHSGPSYIDTHTLSRSQGKIPEVFLRGCGLRDWEVEMANLYRPDLGSDALTDIFRKIRDLRELGA